MNTRQIIKVNNKTKLIEFNDNMQPNDFSKEAGVGISTVHSKYSRITATIVDWTAGKKEKAVVVSHNIYPSIMKAIAHAILSNQIEEFTKMNQRTKKSGFFEQKINHRIKTEEGGIEGNPVTSINIRYQEKMNSPWTITIENGIGIAETTETGGIAIKKGTYKSLRSATVYLSKMQMIQVMAELKNYIENFETIHMEKMLQYREKYEKNKAVS